MTKQMFMKITDIFLSFFTLNKQNAGANIFQQFFQPNEHDLIFCCQWQSLMQLIDALRVENKQKCALYAQSICHKSQRFSCDINFVFILIKLSDQDRSSKGKRQLLKLMLMIEIQHGFTARHHRTTSQSTSRNLREKTKITNIYLPFSFPPPPTVPRRHKVNKIMEFFSAVKKSFSRVHFHPDPTRVESISPRSERANN